MVRLKELREGLQLSQEQLAQKIKTSQRNIGRWENGENEPSVTFVITLADFFGCTTDYLLGREDDYGIITAGQTTVLTKDEEELLSVYRKMDANTKQQTLGFFRAAFSSNF